MIQKELIHWGKHRIILAENESRIKNTVNT